MHRLPLVALVAALFFASPVHAFNWAMYLPAITACDSYPFPSCRGRSTCRESGKYWYNGQCNQAKHQDQAALEKLAGQWDVTFHYVNPCGEPVSFDFEGFYQLDLDSSLISDDNAQIVQLEGKVLSIADPGSYWPRRPNVATTDAPHYSYAILGHSAYTYVLKDVNISWGIGFGWCQRPDGTLVPGGLEILPGDTCIYSFNLVTPTTMKGRACLVDADVCINFTGEFRQPAAVPPLRRMR